MRKKYTGLVIGGGILVILLVWISSSYNSLVKKQEKVGQQWSEIQSTYQRRLDLSLVERIPQPEDHRAEAERRRVFEEGLPAGIVVQPVPEFEADVHDLPSLARFADVVCGAC